MVGLIGRQRTTLNQVCRPGVYTSKITLGVHVKPVKGKVNRLKRLVWLSCITTKRTTRGKVNCLIIDTSSVCGWFDQLADCALHSGVQAWGVHIKDYTGREASQMGK